MNVRPAQPSDLTDVVALRAEMFRAMGSTGVDDHAWRASAQRWFAARLDDESVCIVVVVHDEQVVATAMAARRDSAPSPSAPSGGDVLISNVCTRPDSRGRGFGRAAFAAVMDWARATGVARAELLATQAGRSIYEAEGFVVTEHPAMRALLSAPHPEPS